MPIGIEKQNYGHYISEQELKDANVFIESISRLLFIAAPEIILYLDQRNKYIVSGRGIIRGAYFPKENHIGVAINYSFEDTKDIIKTIKHEISEWLQYIIEGKLNDRSQFLHSDDNLFRYLRYAVEKTYPFDSEKLVKVIEKIELR